jgi:signal transduction histidine kinase
LSLYRIVEEALTNVLKHSVPSKVLVQLSFQASQLKITIEDDGEPVHPTDRPIRPGHGLLGMRERVAALGGGFEAGALLGGGFKVEARLPIEDAG